ncbi:MAG: filamentous hemagglutinin N-terminal domain-containing protein, partial [Desulfovibrio sp.]|nr:filamentous hemagglutinin N-terminal domain-containing protein [Desulfovibrio sp.]
MRQASRLLVAALIGLLIMPPHAYAERPLTPDPNAPANMRPGIDSAPNGVPMVNIANPSSSGMSHNLYRDFNVNKQGLIFNNSKGASLTQLGGIIMANPNLSGSPAKVILNEVTSANRSHIEGYMEVGGRKADLILANPNGITVNGGGYINVGAATLTTGKPLVSGGNLQGFDVNQGNVRVEGAGINATRADAFSILSRTAEIAADVYANDLTVVAGKNEIRGSRVTPRAGAGDDETKPAVAVDSSLLGGMYANRISIIATEKGVGVNLEGMAQSAGDMAITADGKLVLRRTAAGGNAALASNSRVNIQDSAYAGGDLAVSSKKAESGGVLAAGGNVNIAADGIALDGALIAAGVDASGNMGVSGDVNIRSGNLEAKNTQVLSGGSTTLEADKAVLNKVTAMAGDKALLAGGEFSAADSEVQAASLKVKAGDVKLANTKLEALLDMEFRVALSELDNSRLSAGGDLYAFFDSAGLQKDSALAAGGDLFLQGGNLSIDRAFLAAGRDLEYVGESLKNTGGAIFAVRDQFLFMSGELLNDSGDIYAGRDIVIGPAGDPSAGSLRNLSGTITAGNNLLISASVVENGKRVFSIAERGNHVSSSSWYQCNKPLLGHGCDRRQQWFYVNVYEDYIAQDSPAGKLLAAGDILISADSFVNRYSTVAAGNNLEIAATDVSNTDAILQRTTTVRETFKGWDADDDYTGEYFLSYNESYEEIGRVRSLLSAGSDLYVEAADTFSNLSERQGISLPNDSSANADYPFKGSPMFRPVAAPGHRYLIETNPLFVNFGIFFGSDYFLGRLGVDLNLLHAQLLGDAFYETRLVQDQVMAATGQRFLSGYGTDADQMRGLMDNAVAQAAGLQLSLSVALSPEQVAALTHDIIWLVEEEYMGQKVLAPRLYLASATADDIMPNGGVQARNVYVNAGKNLLNEGVINGGTVNLASLDITNSGGLLRGGTLNLTALNDIYNNSGFMTADNINLLAGGNIVSQTLTRVDPGNGRNIHVSAQAGIEAKNNVTATAGNDLTIKGSRLNAGGDVSLAAGRDLTVGTVASEFHVGNGGGRLRVDKVTHTGSAVNAGGDMTMTAGRDLTIAGSQAAAGGDALLAARNNLSVVSVQDTFSSFVKTNSNSG